MATYRIAIEPDNKTYRLVKIQGLRIIVIYPHGQLVLQARCNSLDDIFRLADYQDYVQYAPDYDTTPDTRF